MVIRISNRGVIAKLKYVHAMSKESYSNIFENVFSKEEVEESVTEITSTTIYNSAKEFQRVARCISPNTHGMIEMVKMFLLKLNGISDISERDRISLSIYEELENMRERMFLPRLLKSV